MSELLGHQDCIDSLRKDLVDLQGAILDVFSRTGPVRFSSWKFPDKLSCNVDMLALLEQYDYVDGEDAFSQHSHVVLLELVIDRMLLLLQSFNAFAERVRCSHRGETQQKGCQLSVGLVVRNYWSNLVQLATLKGTHKNTKEQTKSKTLASDEISVRHSISAPSLTSSLKFLPHNHAPSSLHHSGPCYPKADFHNVGCQTVESSLVPCDACHRVQSVLRKAGHALVDLFQSEGLPSSLRPLLAAVEETLEPGHMTAGDVTQWANEQLRDTRRLAKHLQDVRGTVRPLQDRLAAAEADRERFRFQLERVQKEFKQEVEKHQVDTVQLEFSLQKAQRSVKETEQRLQEEQQQHNRETLCLKESNSSLKETVAVQQDTIQALECEKNVLQERVSSLQVEDEACHKLQQRVQQLESQISETQLRLDKETAKYHSACRQQQSMQAKQTSLLKRVDALDEECEELQRQLGEGEERQIGLHNQLQHMSQEKEQVHAQLDQQQDLCLGLQQEKQTLETNVGELQGGVAELEEYVKALRERERLLVAFPELSPLAQAQPQSTGNLLLDMEQQFQANNIRIKVLEQENTTLHSSLVKLRERARRNATRGASPQQAWGLSLPSTPEDHQQNHPIQMQKSPLQNSSAIQLGGSNRGDGESDLESAGSEKCLSTAAVSPSSLRLHLQSLQLHTGTTAARSHKELRSASLHSRSNQRKKLNHK